MQDRPTFCRVKEAVVRLRLYECVAVLASIRIRVVQFISSTLHPPRSHMRKPRYGVWHLLCIVYQPQKFSLSRVGDPPS